MSEMHWETQLAGDPTDLAMLAEALTDPALAVAARGDGYVLSSTDFEALASAGAVRDRAKEIVTALSGSARLELGAHVSIEVGAVYRVHDDGRRDVTVFPEPAVLHWRGLPVTVIVGTAGGTSQVHRPADPISAWVPLAQSDPRVAKALRLRNHDPLKWVELYRIYEVLADDMGAQPG